MQVNLMWATPDADRAVCDAARISNPQNRSNGNLWRLISYMMRHGHWSPFEMANVCVEIVGAPRYVTRQILRHRSFSFQEHSQRYSAPPDLEMIVPECRMQGETNRQSSLPCHDSALSEEWRREAGKIADAARDLYLRMTKAGVAKEIARAVLPEMTASSLVMNGTLRSWIHFFSVRLEEHTQLETMLVVRECWDVVSPCAPLVFEAARMVFSLPPVPTEMT